MYIKLFGKGYLINLVNTKANILLFLLLKKRSRKIHPIIIAQSETPNMHRPKISPVVGGLFIGKIGDKIPYKLITSFVVIQ